MQTRLKVWPRKSLKFRIRIRSWVIYSTKRDWLHTLLYGILQYTICTIVLAQTYCSSETLVNMKLPNINVSNIYVLYIWVVQYSIYVQCETCHTHVVYSTYTEHSTVHTVCTHTHANQAMALTIAKSVATSTWCLYSAVLYCTIICSAIYHLSAKHFAGGIALKRAQQGVIFTYCSAVLYLHCTVRA